jgi:hypothetical protein
VQGVYNDMFSQLRTAGHTIDASRQYAALVAARYAARAARFEGQKGNALDLYRSEGVQVRRVLPESLQHIPVDQTDMVINAVRDGSKLPSDRDLFGPSLTEFAKERGGIIDDEGELKAMDADKQVRGLLQTAKGVPGENELRPDSVTRAAWEAGYFPEHGERPEPTHLYEAIREELAGNKRYAGGSESDVRASFKAAVADMDRFLNEQGIDARTATNAEIKAKLAAHAIDDPEGRAFEQGEAEEPVATLKGDEIAPKQADLKTLRTVARKFYDENLRGTKVRSEALGRDVEFRGSRKAFSASANPDKLRLFAALPEIIAKGDPVVSMPPRDVAVEPTTKAYHFLRAKVRTDTGVHDVGVTIREDANGNLYYNHAIIDEEGRSPPGAPLDTARKAGPGSAGGGTAHEQNIIPPEDGINLSVLSQFEL